MFMAPARNPPKDPHSETDSRYLANLEALTRRAVPVRLKELLEERGLNPNRLAELAHMTPSTVYGSVNGKTTPTLVNLIALASALGVTVDQLLGVSAVESLSRDAWWRASHPGRTDKRH